MLQLMMKSTLAVRGIRAMTLPAALLLAPLAVTLNAQVAAPGTAPIKTTTTVAALAPTTGPSYDNKWEVFGGLLYMNDQAGQNIPVKYNAGGGEGMATYWLGTPRSSSVLFRHLGVSADYRFAAGTTPTQKSNGGVTDAYNLNRVLVQQSIISGGANWRGPHNRYVAIDFLALGGVTQGIFDHATKGYPSNSISQTIGFPTPASIGLYNNSTSPWGAAGGSIDFNGGKKWAIRFQPNITFEHFGTETREYFSLSGGYLYRFGKTTPVK
jgi:hypothetical protein